MLRNLLRNLFLLLTLSFGACELTFGQPTFGNNAEFKGIPTFESLGLYWSPPGKGANVTARVDYKPAGAPDSEYKRGLDLWFDTRTPAPAGGTAGEYRGSLVHLQPNTPYDLKLTLSTGYVLNVPAQASCNDPAVSCTKTWSNTFPVGYSISIPSGTTKVVINAPTAISQPNGTLSNGVYTINVPDAVSPQAYMLVTPAAGVEINQSGRPDAPDQQNNEPCVEIIPGSRYLILRDLVLKSCRGDGIRIKRPAIPPSSIAPATHHIVIDRADISGFGGKNASESNAEQHKGISCMYWTDNGTYNPNDNRPSQIVVQRTKIYNPRHTARNWNFGHPIGPNGIGFERCGTNHVFRYNEIFSTSANRYMDGIFGAENLGEEGSQGFPYGDSDIYGNKISETYDDAIEAEGANRNVRIWKNFTERSYVAIANATTGIGPLYVWRNVSNTMHGMKPSTTQPNNPDADLDRGVFIKGGGPSSFNGGRAYYFHNTVLQAPPPAGFQFPLGPGGGISDSACQGCNLKNFVSHNNIWHIHKDWWQSIETNSAQTDVVANYDLYNGVLTNLPAGSEANGFRFSNTGTGPKPTYAASGTTYPGDAAVPTMANGYTGDFRLTAGTLGHGTHATHATRIHNFNDRDDGDIGAHQSGTGSTLMQFGVAAYPPDTCNVPTAQFSWSQTPPGSLNVTFNASNSVDGSFPISSLTLQFGDGQQETWNDKNQPQSHTYAAYATYPASLTATNQCGTSAPANQDVVVQPAGDIPPATPPAGTLGSSVPTFHSMSLYYNPATTPTNETVWMRYRRASETVWREGWPLWFDPRVTGNALPYAYRARGSAMYLQPDTKYYFEFGTGPSHAAATWHHHLSGTTWAETFVQDGATIPIPAGSTQVNIAAGGSAATGYKIYDGQDNLLALPGTSAQLHCVRVTVSYVIVRRVRCTGAYKWGIAVAPNVTNVVIEESDISDWTWFQGGTIAGWGPYGGNQFGGVHLEGNNSGVVIQRNKIHDPHFGSNPWDFGHPLGPIGITVNSGGMQNVIRYNEIYATGPDKMHWFFDGIGGSDNFSAAGSPGADSDIYHNIIRNVMDDAIEAEGGGRNVRVWGNYIDHTSASGVGTSNTHFGPIYVFRNVTNRVRFYHSSSHPNPDDDAWDRGAGFKAYGFNATGYGGGRQYFFNNTLLQQPGSTYSPPQVFDLGAGESIYGANTQGMRQTWTRNNILHAYRSNSWNVRIGTGGSANDPNYDLYNCCIEESGTAPDGSFEQQGVLGVPTYKAGHGWNAGPRLSYEGGTVGQGNFQLETGSLGLNAGALLPNFTYDIDNMALARKSGVEIGGNPDMGAHENGAQPMKFGLPAAQ